MDNYPGVPMLHAWGESDCNCILHLHVPPTSLIVCGLSLSRSQLDLTVFLWVLRFSSLQKQINSQSKTSSLGAVLRDHA